MMNLFKTTILFSAITMAVGCSNLDSSSEFNDVAKEVKERHNYVQVVAKDIKPDAKAVLGPDVVKSELNYVANFPKAGAQNIGGSYVNMNVTYFKNYDQFDSVAYSAQQFKLETYRPLAETCTEHCTTTQWFKFPLSQEYIQQLNSDSVLFTLVSSTNRNQIEFSVPKAYFTAVIDEADFVTQRTMVQTTAVAAVPSQAVVEPASKTNQMVQYLYSEATSAEQQEFANWAFANRAVVNQPLVSEHKLVIMMADWYQKADKADKAAILAWLISQE
ncbi:hypothetical protein [Vibrio misgurnus]|uniref:hypothetical protein n=1 Tax=Vibrio misgurnus TaxID=2993714 RepID=UPI002416F273|nr:hypothetical protein [Vibrio sp. gvc]